MAPIPNDPPVVAAVFRKSLLEVGKFITTSGCH
jgi:hypothetical protein